LNIIGGILFLAYGVLNFLKRSHPKEETSTIQSITNSKDIVVLIVKGFLLNLANPMVIFYWFSIMTLAHSYVETTSSNYPIFFFLLVILVTFFSIDALKIIGAKYLRPLVTNRLLNGLSILIGIVFSGFGIFLILRGYLEQVQ
jgi:threonine/homoserine/homoserine lactone efflux protein